MRTQSFLVVATLAGFVALAHPAAVAAHDLKAKVEASTQQVKLLAWYAGDGPDDDTPAQQARVTVTDAAGTVVATGTTDDRGVWLGPGLPAGAYEFKVENIGHVARVKLTIEGSGPAEAGTPQRNLWLRAGIGIGAIGLMTAGWWLIRRRKAVVNGG